MRDYKKAREVADRVIALEPNNIAHRRGRAQIDIRERADTRPLHDLDKMSRRRPGRLLSSRFVRGRPVAADQALNAWGQDTFDARSLGGGMRLSRVYAQGLVARLKGDATAAHAAFTDARAQQEEAVRAQSDSGSALCVLGLIDAALGRKEQAL